MFSIISLLLLATSFLRGVAFDEPAVLREGSSGIDHLGRAGDTELFVVVINFFYGFSCYYLSAIYLAFLVPQVVEQIFGIIFRLVEVYLKHLD